MSSDLEPDAFRRITIELRRRRADAQLLNEHAVCVAFDELLNRVEQVRRDAAGLIERVEALPSRITAWEPPIGGDFDPSVVVSAPLDGVYSVNGERRECHKGDVLARLNEVRAKIRSYDVGDRPQSPPAALLREEIDLLRQTSGWPRAGAEWCQDPSCPRTIRAGERFTV